MTPHKLEVEGRFGYCICGWSTGPVAAALSFDDIAVEINDDFRAHRRQRQGEAADDRTGRPLDADICFDDELDDWDDEVEDVLTW